MIESEKVLERKLFNLVRSKGGWAVKLEANITAGLPDRLVLMPGGQVFFVELKTTGQKPRKIQKAIHKKLQKLGFAVYIVDSTETLKALPI